MAPSLAPPMTPSPTPTKRPQRMVPIIPAIPRSLEKRKLKEDVNNRKDGGGTGRPIRPTSPGGGEESQVETAVAQTQAVQNGLYNDSDAKYDQKNGQEPVAESVGSNKGFGTVEDGSNLSPEHVQDFGIEKHGFRLPPPFFPKPSPPPIISTDFSSANDIATTSEETSLSIKEHDSSNGSHQSSAENHVTLNAAAPTFHAHPTPPTDVTASPTDSSYEGHDLAQSVHLQQEPTPPNDDALSPIRQTYQGYEAPQNISFYAPPQSSNDPSSPNHSIYQGYAYAPTSYGYSPQSHASQQPIDSSHRTETNVPCEQYYESQPPTYSNEPTYPVLGSQPPLTPSRTPLDPSAQPWSYPTAPPSTMPFDYGYLSSFHPHPMYQSHVRSISQGTSKSDEDAQRADFVDNKSKPVQMNGYEKKTSQLIGESWRNLNGCTSSHVLLVEHLLQQFNVEEYADCRLTLIHENLRFDKTTWSLSSLLLAQSCKLRDLLKSADVDEEGGRRLEIRLTDRFVTPWAMNSALRVLYGERPEMFTLAMIHSAFDANAEPWAFQMDAYLAFVAAGHVLGLENVILHGLQIASSIIDWDNLEHALSFGLESRPSRGTSASAEVIPLSSHSSVGSRERQSSSAFNLTPPSSSTESKPERPSDEGILSVSSNTAEVRSAQDLQIHCLQWIASNLDEFWLFDPSARPLAEVDRLPMTAESRSPLFKSRLSRIQFGDHPSEMHAKANDRNFLVSSIVLSLPFTALKYTFDLGTLPILRQLHAIVKERERRRQIVLQSKSVPWSQRLAAREHEWAEVGYTEWVETTDDGRMTLARTFTGIDRQVSEPSTPNHQKR